MSCDVERLSRYLDGDLALLERRLLDRHIAHCRWCASELDKLRANDRLLWSWGLRRMPIPPSLDGKITRDLGRKRRFGPLLAMSRMMPAALGTSVAALLVLVTANLGTPLQNHAPNAAAAQIASKRTVVKHSATLIMNRHTQAIVGTRSTPVPISDRHYQLGEN
jgi:anti-sigma factor RsiW